MTTMPSRLPILGSVLTTVPHQSFSHPPSSFLSTPIHAMQHGQTHTATCPPTRTYQHHTLQWVTPRFLQCRPAWWSWAVPWPRCLASSSLIPLHPSSSHPAAHHRQTHTATCPPTEAYHHTLPTMGSIPDDYNAIQLGDLGQCLGHGVAPLVFGGQLLLNGVAHQHHLLQAQQVVDAGQLRHVLYVVVGHVQYLDVRHSQAGDSLVKCWVVDDDQTGDMNLSYIALFNK